MQTVPANLSRTLTPEKSATEAADWKVAKPEPFQPASGTA